MNKIITITCSLFLIFNLHAQSPLDVQIEIFEPYPVELEYYLENADNLFITVQNVTGIEQRVYYHVRLVGNNGVDISTLPNVKPMEPVSILPNYTKFYSSVELEQDFPFTYPDDIDLSGLTAEQYDYISFNRALPEGTYQLCITAIDYDTDLPLTFDCSEEFSVSYGDVPFIYDPPHEDIVPATANNILTIAWEPPFTLAPPPGTFTYELKMIDITDFPFGDLQQEMDDPGNLLVFEEWALETEVYVYDFLANIPLEEGHEYALRVQAIDQSGTYNLSNNGYSEVSTFWYGYNPDDDIDSEGEPTETADSNDCLQSCYYSESMNENAAGDVSTLNEISVGHFTMEEISWSSTSGSNASGTGKITIPFLNDIQVNVEFNGLEINSSGRVFGGFITAVKDQVYDPTQMTSTLAEEMNNFIRNGRVIGSLIGGGSIGLPIALNQNVAGHNFMFGITEMEFGPDRASCTLMQNTHIPQFGDEGWVSMAGSDICLNPGGFSNEYILHPVNDLTIPYQGDMTFLLSGSTSSDTAVIKEEGMYLHGDCNGLKEFGLRGEVHFPESTLVKENEDGEIIDGKVIGSFHTKYTRDLGASENVYATFGEEGIPEESGIHFMVSADIEPFQIAGIHGWGFETNEIWIDISDYENPPNIDWPESYDDANINVDNDGVASMGMTWTGVYIENLDVKPPKELFNGNNREGLSFNHMIIDPLITATVAIEDLIIPRDEGGIDGWSLSMDSLFLTVVQNRLESGGFSGELGIPLTDEGQYFRYTALIEDGNTENTTLDPPSYAFSVSPSDDIDFPFLVASASLSENSHVIGKFTPGNDQETYFETWLEGGIGISSSLFTPEDEDAGIPLELPLVDFQLVYHSQNGFSESHFGFTESLESWSSDSGGQIEYDNSFGLQFSNESFGGFPLNIEEAGLLPISSTEFQFSITPSVSIAGKEGGIAGSVGITFDSKIEEKKGEKKLKLKGFGVTSLSIDADVYGLQLEGAVEFYNTLGSDQVGSKGARGDIQVMLPMGTGVKFSADFGTQVTDPDAAFGTAENFNYWYVDGMAYFAPAGIPIPPIAGIYGLGGGIYINMVQGTEEPMTNDDVIAMMEEVNNLQSSSEGNNDVVETGLIPEPSFGDYGVKLATTLGTLPTETLLNMDVSLYASFNKNEGINAISITGDAYIFTPLSMRNKANLWATADFNWRKENTSDQTFFGGFEVFVNTPMIHGDPDNLNKMIDASFYTSTETGEWYFHAGNPKDRGELHIDFPIVGGVEASGYFMTGHGLPTELPIPERVAWLMDNPDEGDSDNGLDNDSPVKKNGEKRSEGEADIAALGSGVAFGAELVVTTGIDAFLIYATLEAFLGFDINITKSSERTCFIPGEGTIAPGINDWYARGQVYAGLEGDIGIRFKFKKKNFDLSIFKMGAAMMLSGGGPNPEWVEGRAGVYYKVLNGLVKGYKKFDVTVGDKCVPAYDDPFGDLEIIYETYPVNDEEDVSTFVDPMVSFLLPVNEEFTLPTYDADGKTIDLRLKLQLDRFKLEDTNGVDVKEEDEVWNDEKNQLTLKIGEVLPEYTWYDAEVKITALEFKNGSWVDMKDEDDEDWFEKRKWSFKTGELPYPIPDDEIYTTIPIRRQRFVLEDEVLLNIGKIQFTMDMKNEEDGYFPEDNEDWNYSYYVRYQDLKGGDPSIFDLPSIETSNSVDDILTTFPDLKQSTIYSCQLIRKKEKILNGPLILDGSNLVTIDFSNIDDINKMGSTTELDVTGLSLDPGKSLSSNEELIYQYYFRTSKYDSAEEKLAGATIDYHINIENSDKYAFPILELYLDEGFDIFDVVGEVNAEQELVTSPRFKFYSVEENNDGGGYLESYGVTFSDSKMSSNEIETTAIETSGAPGMEGYFDYIRDKWDTFIEDASPFWEGSNVPGYTGGTYDIDHSHSKVNLFGDIVYSYKTERENAPAPPNNEYLWQINYLNDNIETDFNSLISGYKGALTDDEIVNSWENHLEQQEYMSDLLSDTKNMNFDDAITGGAFGNNNWTGQGSLANETDFTELGLNEGNWGPVSNTNKTQGTQTLSGQDIILDSGAGSNNNFSNPPEGIQTHGGKDVVLDTGFDNSNEGSTGTIVVTSVEVIDDTEDLGPVRLTIPYDIFRRAETDAYQLWNYGYDLYFEYTYLKFKFEYTHAGVEFTEYESIDKLRWQQLIRDEYDELKDAYINMEDRSDYYMNANPGNYKLSIEGSLGFSLDHIPGGGKKKYNFNLN